MRWNLSSAKTLPQASPRSFRFSKSYTGGVQSILDRQTACGKPIDLAWLLDARRHHDTITIDTLEVDSAQDLLLLMQYEQPTDHPEARGITVYPVQLSRSATTAHGVSQTHHLARKASIFAEWDGDRPAEGQPSLEVELHLCGDHFALFVLYTESPRVLIYNWKTGKEVAAVDTDARYSDATSKMLVEDFPLCLHQFTWITPRVFMLGSIQQQTCEDAVDCLYIYELSGDKGEPLSRSVMLELPRWKSKLGDQAVYKELTIQTGSWNEDIYPGALSGNVFRRVTVVHDECMGNKPEHVYHIFYVLRNDLLLQTLAQHNRQQLPWEQWGWTCARAFAEGSIRMNASVDLEIQVFGPQVMMTQSKHAQQTRNVTVLDFDQAGLDPRLTGHVRMQGSATNVAMFENDSVWSALPYRRIPIYGPIGSNGKLFLRADGVLYTRSNSDNWWTNAVVLPAQVELPPVAYSTGAVLDQ
ncbi:unnamed protein product [Peniophora sp. CBMAI 1063]|nr:unnamed protein product [Peniophora sp. CBMAI 1063]